MSRVLWRLGRRHYLHHPWQGGLALLGVALGVAVVVAIEATNGSALAAFRLSTQAVVGKATHQIVGDSSGVPDDLYANLRSAGVRPSTPVVEGRVIYRLAEPVSLSLLGVDPLSEGDFRSYVDTQTAPDLDLPRFLTVPGGVVLETQAAASLDLEVGSRFSVETATRITELEVLGLLQITDATTRKAIRNFLVTDVATAQEVLGLEGSLSRIDLILPEAEDASARLEGIRALLPAGVRLERSSSRAEAAADMTRSFRLNLRALSLLALFCGAFLIYNTITFSVVQRRHMLGTLRALGVTRGEVLSTLLSEAALVGVVGTVLGILAGKALAKRLLTLVTQSINDHYFIVTVQEAVLPGSVFAIAVLLGVGASILGALAPALEAVGAAPRASLQRSELESGTRRAVPRVTLIGALLVIAGTVLLGRFGSLGTGFTGFFLLLLGLACFTPAATLGLVRLLTPVAGGLAGNLGRIAARGISAALSRTAIAIAALTIAVAVSVGIDLMIRSFRKTVDNWLEASLPADLYVSLRDPQIDRFSTRPAGLDPALVEALRRLPGAQRVNTVRQVEVELRSESPDGSISGPTRLLAYDLDERGREAIVLKSGEPSEAWNAFDTGAAVLVSEPLAYRRNLEVGAQIELETPKGVRQFRVAAIHYDYVSERGAVILGHRAYGELWDDNLTTAASIYLSSDSDPDALAERIWTTATSTGSKNRTEALQVRSNRAIRRLSLEVFDRTFVVTRVLRLLAVLVAAVGILSALTALQLERVREIGVLRANGLTPLQVWGLVASETGLMGLIAGLLALPLGWLIAVLMIKVINQRSFGWTMGMEVDFVALLTALGIAIGSALVAGLYPAYRMARVPPAEALRGR